MLKKFMLGMCLVFIGSALWMPAQVYALTIILKKATSGSLELLVEGKGFGSNYVGTTVLVGNALNMEVSIACINPANNGVFPGTVFSPTATILHEIQPGDITGKGKVTVLLVYNLTQFEVNQNCVNPNWDAVDNSAWVQKTTVKLDLYGCMGGDVNDGDICTDTENNVTTFTYGGPVLATNTYVCTVPSTATRNADGTAPVGVAYECLKIT